ncbi:MAG: permease-like cell division protein FtsX [Bacteroidota bacterium]|nr:permease-like cell division protein FtsX [Bacteroidota bacterium]
MSKHKSISTARVFNSRFTSTLTISLVLLLLGVMLTLGFLAKDLSVYVRENMCLSVVVNDDLQLPDARMFEKKLETAPWARSVNYIDKETALKELVAQLGDNPEDLLGYNPALASFEIYLKADYANPDSVAKIDLYLRQFKNVQDVIYRKDLVHLVNDNVKRISFALLIVAILLTFISYSMIRNTVRLMIYSKRFLIRTMQLVGAGKGFIQKPFLLENLWSGIIASILAMCYLYGLLYYLDGKISGILHIMDPQMLVIVFVSILIFGIAIMTTATWLAVNRYLKMDTNELYYI